jgi:hypothetical protein
MTTHFCLIACLSTSLMLHAAEPTAFDSIDTAIAKGTLDDIQAYLKAPPHAHHSNWQSYAKKPTPPCYCSKPVPIPTPATRPNAARST